MYRRKQTSVTQTDDVTIQSMQLAASNGKNVADEDWSVQAYVYIID
jgi:hypothetical protein